MSHGRYFDTGADDGMDTALRLPKVVFPVPETAPAMQAVQVGVPWRRVTLIALIFWGISRIVYLLLGLIAGWLPQVPGAHGPGLLGLWQRFDTNWYLGIASQEYSRPAQIAFFPLYPALIRVASVVTGGNLLVAALLVANVTCLTACIAVGGLAARELRDMRAVTFSILALLLYPFSFFLTAAYTEGLFVTFAALSLLFARQGRWRLAGLMALLAAATRPTGVALIAPLAWEWLRQRQLTHPAIGAALLRPGRLQVARGWLRELARAARADWAGVLAVVAAPAFIAAMAAYAGLRFHHPLLIFYVRRDYWGLKSAPILTTLYREVSDVFLNPLGSTTQFVILLDLLALVAVTIAAIVWFRRTPFAFTLYTLGLLYLTVSQPTSGGLQALQGPGRYLVPALPLFLGMSEALERRPKLALTIFTLCAVLQGVIALRFLTGVLIE